MRKRILRLYGFIGCVTPQADETGDRQPLRRACAGCADFGKPGAPPCCPSVHGRRPTPCSRVTNRRGSCARGHGAR